MKAGYFWGGLALLGMVGVCFAGRFTSNTVGVRLYSVAFCIALVAAGVVFTILAATSEPDQRGGFLGLAIISYAMAGAAVALIIALERRLRRSQPRAPTDRSSPPARDRE